MLYLYTIMMLAWDLDKDTHAYFREYLDAFINKRKISKDLRGFVMDTQTYANTIYIRPWPMVCDNFIALRIGLPYRVFRGPEKMPVVVHRQQRPREPDEIRRIHPPKYYHNARKLSTPWNSHTNP